MSRDSLTLTLSLRERGLVLLALSLFLLAGCGSTQTVDSGPVVAAFRDCLYTYYEQRASGERPAKPLLERRARAGGLLIAELERRGVKVTEEEAREGLAGIAPKVERLLHTRTALAFAEVEPAAPLAKGERRRANDFPGSFLVADGVTRDEGRTAPSGARYHAVLFERALVQPYDEWRGAAPAAAFVAGRVVYARAGPDAERRVADAAAARFSGPP